MADKFNNEQLLPAADKIAQNAKPTADKLTEGQIKPAAQKIQEQAVPRTKDFTEGTLQPGAKRLADNAEPMADKLIEQGVKPLADVSLPNTCTALTVPKLFGMLNLLNWQFITWGVQRCRCPSSLEQFGFSADVWKKLFDRTCVLHQRG